MGPNEILWIFFRMLLGISILVGGAIWVFAILERRYENKKYYY